MFSKIHIRIRIIICNTFHYVTLMMWHLDTFKLRNFKFGFSQFHSRVLFRLNAVLFMNTSIKDHQAKLQRNKN